MPTSESRTQRLASEKKQKHYEQTTLHDTLLRQIVHNTVVSRLPAKNALHALTY